MPPPDGRDLPPGPERIIVLALLALLAVGCLVVLRPFLSALLWAGILAWATFPAFAWIRTRTRLPGGWVATAIVLVMACVVIVPLTIAIPASGDDLNALRREFQDWIARGPPLAPPWVGEIPLLGPPLAGQWNRLAEDLTGVLDLLAPYARMLAEFGWSVVLGIAQGVLEFALALFLGWFLLIHGEAIARKLSAISHRLGGERAHNVLTVTGATVRGTVYGLLGTAVVQGILTTLGLWVAGVPRPVLLGTVAGLISVLPVGAPVVWIPAALWLMVKGQMIHGIGLALWGGIAISGADSIIRPWFIARGANLPFLLTILGVLGGAIAFGFLGIFLGPVLLGIGFTVLNEWLLGPGLPASAGSPEDSGSPGT